MENLDCSSYDGISKYTMPVAEVVAKSLIAIGYIVFALIALVWLPISKTRQALRCE